MPWWRLKELEQDLDRELRSDLDLEISEQQEKGLSPEHALSAARRALGNSAQIQDVREAWGWTSVERLLQDVRFAIRLLRKQWGFTLAALLTLALGIGVNAAMFSVILAVLIEPLPYPHAGRLMFLAASTATGGPISFSYPDVLDWQRQTRAFESLAAYQSFGFTITGAGETQRFPGRAVSASFFSTLGVTPAIGRDFLPQDGRPGSQPVVIITDRLWRRFFGADRGIGNRNLTLNGTSFSVIGVLPPEFQLYQAAEIFAPIGLGLRSSARGERKGIYALGRLRPDATLQQARLEADLIARQLAGQFPETNRGVGATAEPLAENFVGKTRPVLLVPFGAVVFVLLIACANIANLLLARLASRQKEIALRMALGAGRFRLMRQMLTENLRLAIAGGALGFVAGKWSLQAIDALLPAAITRLKVPAFNGWVLGFTLLVSIVTGFLFGLAPARYTLGQARLVIGGRRSHLNLLIAVEVALSLALLIGSGLMIRILLSLRGVDPGFHARNALHTQIVLPQPQSAAERQIEFFEQAIGRTRSLPGVNRVSAVMCLPLSGSCWSNPAEVEGRQAPSTQTQSEVNFNSAAPAYFRAMGIPFLEGRDFAALDRKDSALVAIVSQSFVRRYLDGAGALGRRVRERSLPTGRLGPQSSP